MLASPANVGTSNDSGVHVLSSCATVEEFVSKFRRFCSGNSVFVPTSSPVPLGVQDHFSIRLRDGETVLSGLGEVIESQTTASADGTSRMVGMRINFTALDPSSQSVFQWLVAAGKIARGQTGGTPVPHPRTVLTGRAPSRAQTTLRAVAHRIKRLLGFGWRRHVAAHALGLAVGLSVAYQIWGS